MRRDIDDALKGWPSEPSPGEIQVREVRARDGREVLQVRIELGVLQLEQEGRPDGTRPHGFPTYLAYLEHRVKLAGDKGLSADWLMEPEHCNEADREFVQFYHRRVAWLALHRYDRALRDAEHTLSLMNFVAEHGMNDGYVAAHERLRGLVLFHRTQAAAALALERRRPEEALDALLVGEDELRKHQNEWSASFEEDELPDGTLIDQIREQGQEIRRNFAIGKTLREQLAEAIEDEDYERAARLRDQLRRKSERAT